ncbi:MAG: FHA domain-containing protein [Acidobacteriota bacterium]
MREWKGFDFDLEAKPTARLESIEGPLKGEKVYIYSRGLFVGRKRENDLVLEDPLVSKSHARIEQDLSGFKIEDLGSKNGVYVNDRLIKSQYLKDGDFIKIGSSLFKFFEEKAEEDSGVVFEKGKREIPYKKASQKKKSPAFRMILMLLLVLFLGIIIIAILPSGKKPEERSLTQETKVEEKTSIPSSSETKPSVELEKTQKQLTEEEKLKFEEYMKSGDLNFYQGEFTQATEFYKEALKIDPSNKECIDKLERAEAELKNLIESINKRAQQYYESLFYQKAIDEWQKVIDLVKDPSNVYYKEAQKNIEKTKEKLR